MFKANVRLIAEIFSRLTREECGPCPVFACYTLAFAIPMKEETLEETSVRLIAKCQLGTIQCVEMAAFAGNQDKLSKPISPVLGDSDQRSVSVDICRAVNLRSSPHPLPLSRISQLEI